MTQVEIISENETSNGWSFAAQLLDGEGMLHQHEVHVSWADYNHWSTGSDAPEDVAAAVLRFLAARMAPAEIRPQFDASIVRKLYQDADDQITRMLGSS